MRLSRQDVRVCVCPGRYALAVGKVRLRMDLNQAWFVESARWPVTYGGLAGLRGFEVRASFSES